MLQSRGISVSGRILKSAKILRIRKKNDNKKIITLITIVIMMISVIITDHK